MEHSSSVVAEISKQQQNLNQAMTRFQAHFRKSGLAEKMLGDECQICKNPGMFSIKEHLILVLVGILFETFDELARTEPFFSNVGNSCLGI
jgi:hypothetical protein